GRPGRRAVIVAVVARRTEAEVRAALAALAADARADGAEVMAEVRLDALDAPSPDVCRGAPLPVLATCRRPRDGGRFRGAEDARAALLRGAAEAGAAWIDVEADLLPAFVKPPGARLVASHHDFDGLACDVRSLAKALLAAGADLVKIAIRVRNATELTALSRAADVAPGKVTAIGLGPAGLPSRLLAERMRSPWTYVRYDGPGAGPSPVPLPAELPTFELYARLYRDGAAGPAPEAAYAVLGDRAEESIGPLVFNRVFRACGLPACYVPFPTTSTVAVREACRRFGIRGLSVTTPFKVAALDLADEVHPRARAVGAANTLVNEGGVWTAYDTDVDGVSEPTRAWLRRRSRDARTVRAGVVGLGGAGAAAAWALRSLGCRTTFVSRRDPPPPSPLDGVPTATRAAIAPAAFDLVVNATPAGSPRDPRGRAVDLDWIASGGAYFETNYRPRRTPTALDAQDRGLDVIGGDAMYAAQAAAQLALFRADADPAAVAAIAEATSWALDRTP
ncbi:MAG TPA: type I 3-dehydroquinate dehydratase, partial [Planctomycetota bacterium]|nr:type I 3-dehydroquinate dehydratase [Planctomycetota bacterium]